MNAETPILSAAECGQFLAFWMEVTGVAHVTLVAIVPDGKTTACTFAQGDERVLPWIETMQNNGCNIYFQPNETHPGCARKPAKAEMAAILCRHADIDPVLPDFTLDEERDRLRQLAEFLRDDPGFPPTALIDSGGGIQALWACERRELDPPPSTVKWERVDRENLIVEGALGGHGTHNFDRLLRLPGTVNFPNRRKVSLGRGASRARLIFSGPAFYRPDEIQSRIHGTHGWCGRVAACGLVRAVRRPDAADSPGGTAEAKSDDDVGELVADLLAAGADGITQVEGLPFDLGVKLALAIKARKRLADRWAGMIDDLTAAGKDDSRSGAEISLAAMLKAAGWWMMTGGACSIPGLFLTMPRYAGTSRQRGETLPTWTRY